MFVSKPDCFANKHTNDKLKYWVCSDSGAAISVMNNKCLFDNDKFTNVGSVKDRSEKGVLGQVADYGTQKGRQRTKSRSRWRSSSASLQAFQQGLLVLTCMVNNGLCRDLCMY